MAIYQYKCPNCEEQLEKSKKMKERNNKEKCPKCNTEMSRLISNTSFHLKGKGWYVTDYKKTAKSDSD
ncbi:MAG TPA: zinc ribbon domain-containing protein [bacterium]|nr:zinc ribbon domain-containing protein [bacterium]